MAEQLSISLLGQRGTPSYDKNGQKSYSLTDLASPSNEGKVASFQSQRPTPRFSGVLNLRAWVPTSATQWLKTKAVQVCLPIFENFTEVFLWGFIAQDVLSMWAPRIRQSLIRGAIKYDPRTDSSNQGLTPFQLFKKYWANTIKGWNWVNFSEETKREIATGPGVLLIPAIAYSIARRTLGKTSVEIGHGPLSLITEQFKAHLENSLLAKSTKVTPAEYQNELKKFILSLFGFSKAERVCPLQAIAGHEDLLKHYQREFPKVASKTFEPFAQILNSAKEKKPLGEVLEQWADLWVKTIYNHQGVSKKHQGKLLHEVEHLLERLLTDGYNRQYHQILNFYEIDCLPVARHILPQAKGSVSLAVQTPINEFLHHLNRWKDFAITVFEKKTTAGRFRQGVSDFLPQLVDKIYQQLVTKKALYALTVSLITGVYLVRLAKWAQSHENYEANRLLQEKTPLKKGIAKGSQQQEPTRRKMTLDETVRPVALKDLEGSQEVRPSKPAVTFTPLPEDVLKTLLEPSRENKSPPPDSAQALKSSVVSSPSSSGFLSNLHPSYSFPAGWAMGSLPIPSNFAPSGGISPGTWGNTPVGSYPSSYSSGNTPIPAPNTFNSIPTGFPAYGGFWPVGSYPVYPDPALGQYQYTASPGYFSSERGIGGPV